MDDRFKDTSKQILLLLVILVGPALVGWIFGVWGAIVMLTCFLAVIGHLIMKYQG